MDATPLSPAPHPRENPNEVGPEPYRVHIPTRYLELTQQKFADARLPAELAAEVAGWDEDHRVRMEMDTLVDHWHETYSWRHEEEVLNTLPQFRLAVPILPFGPMRHHFLWHRASTTTTTTTTTTINSASASSSSASTSHQKPASPPILLLGEFWEFLRLFRILQGRDVDVVLPSPPGMGFSDAPAKAGFSVESCAIGFNALMAHLGYAAYVVHGAGTLGWAVARMLALRFPEGVRGVHLCHVPAAVRGGWWARAKLRARKGLGLDSGDGNAVETAVEVATMGRERVVREYALTDSPMGLLAWVEGRVRDGRTTKHEWTHNEVLTAFMYYWVSGPRDFFRLLETAREKGELEEVCKRRSKVPVGVFLGKGQSLPRWYVEATLGRVGLFETRPEVVGRWAAWEEPEVVADAVMRFWEVVNK